MGVFFGSKISLPYICGMENNNTNTMEKMTYDRMTQELIMEILYEIVNDFSDPEVIVDIFYDITEEFFTFSGMKKQEAVTFNALIEDIFVKSALQLKKIRG